MNTTSPECALPGLTSANNSSKKRISCNDIPTAIKNYMDGTLKSIVNPIIVSDKFPTFGEMMSEELKYLSLVNKYIQKS